MIMNKYNNYNILDKVDILTIDIIIEFILKY